MLWGFAVTFPGTVVLGCQAMVVQSSSGSRSLTGPVPTAGGDQEQLRDLSLQKRGVSSTPGNQTGNITQRLFEVFCWYPHFHGSLR